MDGPRPAQPPGLGRVSATPGMARANLSRSSMPAASMANHYGEQRVNNLPGPPPAGKEQLARLEHRSISLTRVSKNPESRIRELQRNSMAGQVGRTSLGVGRISRTSDSSAPEDRPADVQNLNFEVCIVSTATGVPVSYKLDGERFQVRETLKLFENAEYRITMKVKPALRLEQNVITFDARAADSARAPIELNDAVYFESENFGTYSGFWKCQLKTSPKGERTLLNMGMEIQEFGKVRFPLLCKVYKQGSSGATNGQICKTISYRVKKATDPNHTGHIQHTMYIEGSA
eukprot:CAMPEP_0177753088 /NCGR_PEP_ID=MMETSP0491_2-20121128/1268_1 /TAXON_ID=63592 /ORGANISM="Tetraselmis chuii, Strain PLY429" /LENGTH=288 /DNA_ID=CAMNT_0019268339 /DNA_START=133 /DNA_END=999 /DNA_ORIENTATION=-